MELREDDAILEAQTSGQFLSWVVKLPKRT
jgi:hypothetical protein